MINKPGILSRKALERAGVTVDKPSYDAIFTIALQSQNDYCYKEMLGQFRDLLWATSANTKDTQLYRDIIQSQLEEIKGEEIKWTKLRK